MSDWRRVDTRGVGCGLVVLSAMTVIVLCIWLYVFLLKGSS